MEDSTNSTESDESWATVGRHVELHGLVKAPHLNGRIGIIASGKQASNGRYTISLQHPWKDPATEKLKHNSLALKASNFRPMQDFKDGQRLRLSMLPCNGCRNLFDRDMLQKCSQCRYTRYCSKKCQTAHWKGVHKQDCKVLCDASRDKQLSASNRVWAGMERGKKLVLRGKIAEAEREFRTLIEEEGFYAIGAYVNLGTSVLMQKRVDEALVLFQTATIMPPIMGHEDEHALCEAYMQLGHLLQHQKRDVDGAIFAYREVLKIQPQHPEALGNLQKITGQSG